MKTKPLYQYQERVHEFIKDKPRAGIFAFYGSGKTYMSLRWCEAIEAPPVLILTLKSLLHQWAREIEKYTSFTYSVVAGTAMQRVDALQCNSDLYIINYDAVRSPLVLNKLRMMKFRAVIADESTLLKEGRTLRFKLLRPLTRSIPQRIILTGKPILEKPEEIWAQMLFLDDGETFGRSFWKFRATYFEPGPPWKPYDWTLKLGAEKLIAEKLNRLCVRVAKEEVATELPPKRYTIVRFEMPETVRVKYEILRKEFRMELLEGGEYDTVWALSRAQKMHQLCQGVFYKEEGAYEFWHTLKLDWLQENIPLMVREGPVLIWTNYLRCIPMIAATLHPLPLRVYTGEMGIVEREEALGAFQAGKVDVLVLSEQAGCAGLNLQRANQAVFFSTGYAAGMRENAEDRCHRIGSEIHKSVVYYDLIMEDSLDEVVLETIKNKLGMAEAILKHVKG